ncbi:TetR/AcrR family transcriptional regulator [Deinococcus koreensis]|uniref:TetR/AcrR family transcriptional regulator n=1 Tax=Deinococcus koreensis TaxID=2054903 RepID=A0A2K3UZC5_9DEIO|nr:TetR/AcrR family transcriptional regulator [Deinococcus koreensis]PNY81880.1 TetR/AcrR family transcriptional regulator [Deinococcus koreensis]
MSAPAARRLSAETRRERILEVAETLFIERGFEGVGMNDVAQALGTSRPTVYTYFTSTEDMLRALLDVRLPLLWERLSPLLPALPLAGPLRPPPGPLAADQSSLYSEVFRALLRERELLLLMRSGGGPIFRQQREHFLARLAGLIEPYRPAQRHPWALEVVTLLLEAAAVEALRHPERDPAALARTLGQMIAGGLGALQTGT